MAKVRIIPNKDWEVLKKYLDDNEKMVVLIPENVAEEAIGEFGLSSRKQLHDDGRDYECGGDADVWVDIATSTEHPFFFHNR